MADNPSPSHASDGTQQRPEIQKVADEVSEILTPSEEVLYVCQQNFNAGLKRDSIVATTRRLIFYEPQLFGKFNFRDYLWQDLIDATLDQGMLSSSLTVRLVGGRSETMGNLDKEMARRLYSFCQSFEEEWREKRRQRDIEEARARSGGVVFGGAAAAPPPPPADDPVQKLAQAKAMLDQGLISEEEYNAVKAKILGAM